MGEGISEEKLARALELIDPYLRHHVVLSAIRLGLDVRKEEDKVAVFGLALAAAFRDRYGPLASVVVSNEFVHTAAQALSKVVAIEIPNEAEYDDLIRSSETEFESEGEKKCD